MDDFEIPEDIVETRTASSVIYDLSNEDYHNHKSISKSGLDLIAKSPAHFIKNERKESPAFKKGTLIHCAILEPDYLLSRYHPVNLRYDLRTKKGKALLEEETQLANGKIIVYPDEWNIAIRVRDEIHRHKVTKHLFDGGESEISVFSRLNDVDVRCRPDYINGSVVVDLKSTIEAKNKFKQSVVKLRYFVQDPFYSDILSNEGIGVSNFLFVAIEKTEPFGIAIYELDDDAVSYGRREYTKDLDIYKRCLDSGIWPGYEESIQTLSLPSYLTNGY